MCLQHVPVTSSPEASTPSTSVSRLMMRCAAHHSRVRFRAVADDIRCDAVPDPHISSATSAHVCVCQRTDFPTPGSLREPVAEQISGPPARGPLSLGERRLKRRGGHAMCAACVGHCAGERYPEGSDCRRQQPGHAKRRRGANSMQPAPTTRSIAMHTAPKRFVKIHAAMRSTSISIAMDPMAKTSMTAKTQPQPDKAPTVTAEVLDWMCDARHPPLSTRLLQHSSTPTQNRTEQRLRTMYANRFDTALSAATAAGKHTSPRLVDGWATGCARQDAALATHRQSRVKPSEMSVSNEGKTRQTTIQSIGLKYSDRPDTSDKC